MTRALCVVVALVAACASSTRPPGASNAPRDHAPAVSPLVDASAMAPRPGLCAPRSADRVCFEASMGSLGRATTEGHFEERPPHATRLRSFEVDRDEVSGARWAECVAAQRCSAPSCESPSGEAARCVSWREAGAYCAFRGGRLPTEAEWERVAAGALPERRMFPWGESPNPALAAADRTPDGVAGMGAGVAEWVADLGGFFPAIPQPPRDAGADAIADAEPDASADVEDVTVDAPERTEAGLYVLDDPRGETRSPWRVVRGGDGRIAVEGRTTALRRFRQPDDRLAWVGLRCAYDR